MANAYCDHLGIPVPDLFAVARDPKTNTYGLLIAALLERGGMMTLQEVAERLDEAGIACGVDTLLSLQRCKPARAPVYRDGDRYGLDLHDDQIRFCLLRLGLCPVPAHPAPQRTAPARPEPAPLPDPDQPLTLAELDEALRGPNPPPWSAQRFALAVLDAHGTAMAPDDVIAAVAARTSHCPLEADQPSFRRAGAAIAVDGLGRWTIRDRLALMPMRTAVRARIAAERRRAADRPDPAEADALLRAAEERRQAHAAELAKLRRAVVVAFPPPAPQWVTVVDVRERQLQTFAPGELDRARQRIAAFDVIAALDARALLRALSLPDAAQRLDELGPPQKSRKLNRSGRKLQITTELLLAGSCGITRPFGEPQSLARYLEAGETTKLRRRLEADAKALLALYEYGRLHHYVRLRWGFLDERIPVRWSDFDEPTLDDVLREAAEAGREVEAVVGTAPGWTDPWARARRFRVRSSPFGTALVDAEGRRFDTCDVQRARIAAAAISMD